MAAEYRPDLKEAVDILINGPVEARIPSTEPGVSDWARRLRNWASTPFRRWLTNQPPFLEPAPEAPGRTPQRTRFWELPAERESRLREEVYGLYDALYNVAETFSWLNDSKRYLVDIHYDETKTPANLAIRRQDPEIDVELSNNTEDFHEQRTYNAGLTELGAPRWLTRISNRTTYSAGLPEPLRLEPYSETIDLLALKTVGEEVQRLQEVRVLDDDLEI